VLNSTLLHPEILHALAGAGHGSRILIGDGNYPFTTGANPSAARVYLNLAPGTVDTPTVLAALLSAVPVEAAHGMGPDDGSEPPIFDRFRAMLPPGLAIEQMERFAFYAAAKSPDVALVIATAERQIYANILLTIGVRV
jgi:L-fucose mutarotase